MPLGALVAARPRRHSAWLSVMVLLLCGSLSTQPSRSSSFIPSGFTRPTARSHLLSRRSGGSEAESDESSKALQDAMLALATAEEKLRRAEAFRLEGADILRQEVEALKLKASKLQVQIGGTTLEAVSQTPAPPTSASGTTDQLPDSDKMVKEKALQEMMLALATAETKLRRADAFRLDGADVLRQEVETLKLETSKLQAELDEVSSKAVPQAVSGIRSLPSTDAEWETLAKEMPKMAFEERYEVALRLGKDGRKRIDEIEARLAKDQTFEAPPTANEPSKNKAKGSLSERLNMEKWNAMTDEERIELLQEIGPAFAVSAAIVALGYWSISLPTLCYLYHESTGEWPKFEDVLSMADGGKAFGAFAGVLGLAVLLKPLRLAAAAALTPWAAENVVPYIPGLGGNGDSKQKDGQQK